MADWVNEFEHESITTENRPSFNTAMEKYDTKEAAIVGGFNAMKLTGKPFRLPESMDKLPDDATRSDFTAKTRALLGVVSPAKSVEELADVNFKDGLADDAELNNDLVAAIKSWAVSDGIDKPSLSKMVKFFNGPMAVMAAKATEAAKTAALEGKITDAKACDDTLAAHADFGNADKLKEQGILMERALLNNMGLSADEAAAFAEARKGSICDTNPTMKRVMLKLLAPMAAESSNQTPGGPGAKTIKADDPNKGSPSWVAAGWSTEAEGEEYKKRNAVKV